MPSLWFKHEDPEILPYPVPYADGQDPEPLIAANSGNGWSLAEPDEPAATVDPPADPPRPAKPDHHDEEQ